MRRDRSATLRWRTRRRVLQQWSVQQCLRSNRQNCRLFRRIITDRPWGFDSILIMRNKITRREFASGLLLAPLGASVLRGQQINTGTTVGIKAVKIAVPD